MKNFNFSCRKLIESCKKTSSVEGYNMEIDVWLKSEQLFAFMFESEEM